jgi:urease accessory protein
MDAAGLYRLMAWFSPAYPIGGFSYSHGIEYAVEAGLVADRDALVGWIGWILEEGAGRIDAMLFRAAWDAADDPAALDDVAALAAAFRGTAETSLETMQQGASFLTITRTAWPDPRLDDFVRRNGDAIALPVAAALAVAGRVPLALALSAYLQGLAANLVSAGVRLVPLGQSDGQRALAALESVVRRATAAAMATPLDEIGAAAPMVDWTSMRHELQYARLFRS